MRASSLAMARRAGSAITSWMTSQRSRGFAPPSYSGRRGSAQGSSCRTASWLPPRPFRISVYYIRADLEISHLLSTEAKDQVAAFLPQPAPESRPLRGQKGLSDGLVSWMVVRPRRSAFGSSGSRISGEPKVRNQRLKTIGRRASRRGRRDKGLGPGSETTAARLSLHSGTSSKRRARERK